MHSPKVSQIQPLSKIKINEPKVLKANFTDGFGDEIVPTEVSRASDSFIREINQNSNKVQPLIVP